MHNNYITKSNDINCSQNQKMQNSEIENNNFVYKGEYQQDN